MGMLRAGDDIAVRVAAKVSIPLCVARSGDVACAVSSLGDQPRLPNCRWQGRTSVGSAA